MLKAITLALALAVPAAAGEIDDRRAAELEHLVRQDCGSCHGMTLQGGLGPALLPENLAVYDAQTLAYVILEGMPARAMPGWAPLLSAAEADWIARYLLEGEAP